MREDEFLTGILKRPVVSMQISKDSLVHEIQHQLAEYKPAFCYMKTEATESAFHDVLHQAGFRIADELVQLTRPLPISEQAVPPSGYNLRWASSEDEQPIVELAEVSFTCSRFHSDPSISLDEADTIKGQWAANYFRGTRGDAMAIVEYEGRAVGFVTLIIQGAQVLVDLLAISQLHRGKRLGGTLLVWALEHVQAEGTQRAVVGTQQRNSSALRMYARAGFVEIGRQFVWHWHAPAAVSVT